MSNIVTLNSKLPHVGTTIFTTMGMLATENKAVNLSQGFPDFDCDNRLVQLALEAMEKGLNQYAPMAGNLFLREEIAKKINLIYKKNYNVDSEITVTAGATQAIFTAIAAIINKNDEVIIIEPAYDCYAPSIEAFGGKPVYVKLIFPNFTIDWNVIKEKINANTKAIIINSPNNPAANIITMQDLDTLYQLIKDTNIIVISDEVYEHMVYDNKKHISVCMHKELSNRCFVVSSFGKTYHITGWKIGYIAAPKLLMQEFRKIHQFNVFCVNSIAQQAIAKYMQENNNYLLLNSFYEEKRNYFRSNLNNTKLTLLPCTGSYFQLIDYSALSNLNDTEMAVKLTVENKIASIPMSAFYNDKTDHKILRFCFAKKKETLDKGLEILNNL